MLRPVLRLLFLIVAICSLLIATADTSSATTSLLTENTRSFRTSSPGLVAIPTSALPGADPAKIHVWRRGVEIPIQVSSDTIQFVAQANDSPFSTEAVYWLTADTTSSLRTPLPALIATPLTWERDSVYQSILKTDRGDRWFAGELRADGAPISITLTLPTSVVAGTELELYITPLVRRNEHRIRISRAGMTVGAVVWNDGTTFGPRTVAVPLEQALPAGRVQLDVTLTSEGALEDAVFLDRLVMPKVRVPLPMLPAPQLAPVTTHDLRSGPAPGQAGASYLIITHSTFRPALDPLIAAHRQRGDTVGVVDVQAIYDTFSYGERDPEAIRSLIRTALASWHPAPRAVLLVGAGNVRMRTERSADDPTFIPPYLIDADPKYGQIACDTCYTRITDDVRDQLVPSIPVGRFPVHTLAEAHTLVAKSVAALTASPTGGWRSKVLALTDNDYESDGRPDSAGRFTTVAEQALALLPKLEAERFYYAPERATAAPYYRYPETLRRSFFASFDAGAALMLYVGHASQWQWAFTSAEASTPHLVSLYDADLRVNGARLPILLSMACLSGNWANPILQPIDERLLLSSGGGIAAALTPVGSGVNTGHRHMLAGTLPLLAASKSLGEAHLAGLVSVANTGRDMDLLFSFGILGDPDVSLPRPLDSIYVPVVRR